MNSSMVSCQKKSTADIIFALRMQIEKYREGQREFHCVFVDLEKTYDGDERGTMVFYEEVWSSREVC